MERVGLDGGEDLSTNGIGGESRGGEGFMARSMKTAGPQRYASESGDGATRLRSPAAVGKPWSDSNQWITSRRVG